MNIDFARTSRDCAKHRQGFPELLYQRLARHGLALAGRRTLDLGSGTGLLARALQNHGARVTSLDPCAAQLAAARREATEQGNAMHFTRATAEQLPFRDASIDLITAGQCWWWFDEARALAEIRRVLRPDGWLLITSYDWLPLHDSVVADTEELILAHQPKWRMHGGDGLHPEWIHALDAADYRDISSFSATLPAFYDHADWRGRIRASAGVGASLDDAGVRAFDHELEQLLGERYPHEPLEVPHRLFAVMARPGSGAC